MTPAIEAIARNLVRQEYYRLGLQPSEGVEQYVAKEWPDRISDARAALQALRVPRGGRVGLHRDWQRLS